MRYRIMCVNRLHPRLDFGVDNIALEKAFQCRLSASEAYMKTYGVGAILLMMVMNGVALGGDWAQWRGPHFNGACDEKNLPDKLDKSTEAWSINLPGLSAATPVVAGGRIFVSSLDKNDKLLAMCVNLADGKTIWSKEVGVGHQ